MIEVLLAATLWVGPAMSGSWYTPDRSGEGFTLQVLDDGSALALWFTYSPAGNQAWIYADGGRIDAGCIRFEHAYTTRGPRFGPAYDAAELRLDPWGTLEFRFTSCNAAEVAYAGPAAWGSGTRPLSRLTALAELECGGKRRVGENGARTLEGLRQRGGSWFDPARNGQGWNLEPLPDGRTLVYWFTYDADGEQAWTVGEASGSGTRLVVEPNLRPTGARFGAAFDPAQVQVAPWGRLEIEFSSCNDGIARYASSDAAFGSGTLHAARLSLLAASACIDGAPAVPVNGAWSSDLAMPIANAEIATASTGSGVAYVAGGLPYSDSFLRLDLARLEWESLAPLPGSRHHAVAVAAGGEILLSIGYPLSIGTSGARYSITQGTWQRTESVPAVVASGAAMLGGFAWFGDLTGDLWQYDPRTGQSRHFLADGRAPRDHSQVVAFQGELWMIAGRQQEIDSARVSIFDPASETWRAGPSLQTARGGFAVAASPTILLVAGGEVLATGRRTLASAEGIAAGEQAWRALPSMPIAVHGVGGALHGNAFFAIGGSTRAGIAVNPGVVQIYRW